MKRKIQSLLYLTTLGTMFYLLLKASKGYEHPFSIYYNPVVFVVVLALVIMVFVKETTLYVAQKTKYELKGETVERASLLNVVVHSLFILFGIAGLIKAYMVYEKPFSFYEHPVVMCLAILLANIVVLKEYVYQLALHAVSQLQAEKQGVTPEEEWAWLGKLIKKLTRSRSVEDNQEIILDHNYDGIHELDNVLPPWWVYLFYGTMIFAVIYLVRFEVLDGDTQEQEYIRSIAQAKVDVARYKELHPEAFDFSKIELLTAKGDLDKGKAIFQSNCVACHAADGGGGIGPNLTDTYWVLGGGFKNVVHTILNGGREGKGMVAWKSTLKPEEIQQVASFVMGLQGTVPASPKAPQGEVWKDGK